MSLCALCNLRDFYLDNVAFHSQAETLASGKGGDWHHQHHPIKRILGLLLRTVRLPAWVTVSGAPAGEVPWGQYWLNSCLNKV